ncbi:MAG: HD domain-containing protein [Holophagales bacterium]|nr:HD domain-containing protein [Holophagales bacterium]MYD23706.1 HD domain-containing protein [Holophagales bacterium]MYI33389.1 HD domain-containing protein [Holophagales bacterium]
MQERNPDGASARQTRTGSDARPRAAERHGRLAQQMRFLLEVDQLKQVLRRTSIIGNERLENSAEHSWHLTLMALVLSEHAAASGLDQLKVLKMLIVHDLVEIDAGDTFVYDQAGLEDQEEREQRAAERIFGLLPAESGAELRAIWDEFEARQSPEAKFARALDRLQPMVLNYINGGGPWQEHGVRADQVREINGCIEDGAPELWRYAEELIEDAVRRELLAP